MTLYVIVGATLGVNTLLLAFLAWAFHSTRFASARIEPGKAMKVSPAVRLANIAVSSVLSLAAVVAMTLGLPMTLDAMAWWMIALQALAILVVYDFTYYALHRSLHHKKLMRWIHGVHHRARNPSAMESFYLHPVELVAGLGLLALATWIVGPVHIYAFAVAFFVHSTLNIVIHSGLQFGHAVLWPIDKLTAKHHVHHLDDFSKNYASLTPIPDLIFGTASKTPFSQRTVGTPAQNSGPSAG